MLNRDTILNSKGTLFIVSAPAGTGKSTLVNRLKSELDSIAQSTSHTTRQMRDGEVEGEDYHFVSQEAFEQMMDEDAFLEHAQHFGNYYGTSKKTVENILKSGKHVVLVIDTQGAKSLQNLEIPAVYIFITPPSVEELKRRLIDRATEDKKDLEARLNKVSEELAAIKLYDYHIENNDLDEAYQVLKAIVIAQEHRISK